MTVSVECFHEWKHLTFEIHLWLKNINTCSLQIVNHIGCQFPYNNRLFIWVCVADINLKRPAIRPTDGISIEFEIPSKFAVLWFETCCVDHNEFFAHVTTKLRSAEYDMNKSIAKFNWTSNGYAAVLLFYFHYLGMLQLCGRLTSILNEKIICDKFLSIAVAKFVKSNKGILYLNSPQTLMSLSLKIVYLSIPETFYQ